METVSWYRDEDDEQYEITTTEDRKNMPMNEIRDCLQVQKNSSTRIALLRAVKEAYEDFNSRGKELDALNCLRQAFLLKTELHGVNSKWTLACAMNYVRCCNVVASSLFRNGELEASCSLLLQAQEYPNNQNATLINIAACMYSQELVPDAISYLNQTRKIEEFRAELHLNLCACYFQLGDSRQSLFHAQSAVKYAQQSATKCFSQDNLPLCFKRETLIVLALSYNSLGICLRHHAINITDRTLSIVGLLQGVKWHIKAYEEVATSHEWAIPLNLQNSLWNSLLTACNLCKMQVQQSLGILQDYPDMLFLANVVLEQSSATSVQSITRKYLLRNEYLASVKLQTKVRSHLSRKKLVSRQRKKQSATKVQSVLRGYIARKDFEDINKSILTLQRCSRGSKERRRFKAVKNAAVKATTVLQKHCRRKIAKSKKQSRIRLKEELCASILIQTCIRGKLIRDQFQKNLQEFKAAVVIQCAERVHSAKSALSQLKQIEMLAFQQHAFQIATIAQHKTEAATVIQKNLRKHLSVHELKKAIVAARKLQSFHRGAEIRADYVYLRDTTIDLQKFVRSSLKNIKARNNEAAITIQKNTRGFLLRKKIEQSETYFDTCIVKIQSWARQQSLLSK